MGFKRPLVQIPSLGPLQKPVTAMVTGFLCVSFQVVFPYVFPLQIGNALYEGFHSVCAGLFHLLGDVAIHVQREGSGVVAQVALHGFDVIPGPESCHGVAVAEIVEPRVRQTDRSREAFVVVIDRVGGKMLPSLIAEDKAGILPDRPRPEAVPELLCPMLLQQFDHGGGGGDRAALVVLGGDQAELPRLAGDVLELLVDRDRAALQVYAVPGEATDLSAPHAGKEHGQIYRLEAVALDGPNKGRYGGIV